MSDDEKDLQRANEAFDGFVKALAASDENGVLNMLEHCSDYELWTAMVYASMAKTPDGVDSKLWRFLQYGIGAESRKRGWIPPEVEDPEEAERLAKLSPQEFVHTAIERLPRLNSTELADILFHTRQPAPPEVAATSWNMLRASAKQVAQARGLDVEKLAGPDDVSSADLIRGARVTNLKS